MGKPMEGELNYSHYSKIINFEIKKEHFVVKLLHWHEHFNQRILPWKNEKNPYKIWVSEIILQQTRAEQGLPYYLNFIKAFPNVKKLAAASDNQVYKYWQGLGYYNRCKNMLETAKNIVQNYKGIIPQTYAELLKLKGIGTYTAAAIASFAFDLPHAVVDGNVYRVLSRFFDLEIPIDTTSGKKFYQELAQNLLPPKQAAQYNQAIMDLGATICTPKNALCNSCPLAENCTGLAQHTFGFLPIKEKKIKIETIYWNYLILKCNDEIWLQKRTNGIWENLYEPLVVIDAQILSDHQIKKKVAINGLKSKYELKFIEKITHKLTHKNIHLSFYEIDLNKKEFLIDSAGDWVPINKLKNYPFPQPIFVIFKKMRYL